MPGIDELVRESLRTRAGDVEATPQLWREVQRRTSRRGWLPSLQWAVAAGAAAAAALAAFVVLPDITATDDSAVPSIDDAEDRTDDSGDVATAPQDEEAADDRAADGDDAQGGPSALGTPEAGGGAAGLVTAQGRELVWLAPDGPRVLATLPAEGESRFVDVAVRPGGDATTFTVAALTTAEGMFDLRYVRVVDGEAQGAPAVLEGRYAVTPAVSQVSGPRWTHDGASLVWLEQPADVVTLRTVGWDDGPGTGERATDNATFDLEIDPEPVYTLRQDPTQPSAGRFPFVLDDGAGPRYQVVLERQADDGLALGPDAVTELG